jgi:hypothetical protein
MVLPRRWSAGCLPDHKLQVRRRHRPRSTAGDEQSRFMNLHDSILELASHTSRGGIDIVDREIETPSVALEDASHKYQWVITQAGASHVAVEPVTEMLKERYH